MFSITNKLRLWLTLSSVLVLIGVSLIMYPGLKLGIDFTGGTLIELSFDEDTEKANFENELSEFASENEVDLGQPYILKTSEGGYIVRIKEITNEIHVALSEHLTNKIGTFTEQRFTTIGPTVGNTLKTRSVWAILTAAVVMVLYIAYAFRNIPKKLSPWKFGVIAVIALIHDLIITIGIFVLIGSFTSFEVNTLFVTALLIILGYSVNDTIVIFDRVRENVFNQDRKDTFKEVAERGLQQSIARSINTSLSTLIPLFALYFLGGESIKWFVLTLIVGLIIGTYSSLFLATPLLVFWRKKK
ncbi:protein translocase subunit SecF [Candidatus Peribacteria bacterium]|jgi:preprotein translocase subunit SecF|nr:protein translocase subunit SecF [Candidatus Peribacteria bacterium]MBT4021079.1 protein translocase subunit SecF [Candidatus Peribacteria bacterium]MBT4240800.1 protein translocase subunit SecF [Candidatus Peribacteria bacterium]MBT4474171.1 protein translocase subunit SecF [Candidatus Peribacteria bacterium]